MNKLKLYMEREVNGKTLTLIGFHDEPNAGLCTISYNEWKFVVPCVLAEILFFGVNTLPVKTRIRC